MENKFSIHAEVLMMRRGTLSEEDDRIHSRGRWRKGVRPWGFVRARGQSRKCPFDTQKVRDTYGREDVVA